MARFSSFYNYFLVTYLPIIILNLSSVSSVITSLLLNVNWAWDLHMRPSQDIIYVYLPKIFNISLKI